jgi:hypothetical protein
MVVHVVIPIKLDTCVGSFVEMVLYKELCNILEDIFSRAGVLSNIIHLRRDQEYNET